MNHYARIASICCIPLLLLVGGCGKKEEAQVVEKPKEVVKKVEEIKAPQIYSSPTEQKQFEELFEDAKESFNPPTPGTLVRAEPVNGEAIVGELIRYVPEGVVISTPDPVTVKKEELKEDNKAEFFVDAFAAKMAKVQMDVGTTSPEGKSMYPPAKRGVLEVRKLTAERMIPRAGPGRNYATFDENVVFRGANLRLLDEIKEWVCVSEDKDSAPVLGWIPKFSSSIPFNETSKERVSREVDGLKESGFLISVDPSFHEAVVDSYLWRISDSASVEGIGRLLARYCGQQRNLRVYFVVIKDGQTDRKIAEFSESRGLKLF